MMDRMDPQLKQFYRQYMQQLSDPIIPSGDLLVKVDVQRSLENSFFDPKSADFSPQYQIRVLDRVINKITAAVRDPEEEGVSDKLYEIRAELAQAGTTDVTQKKKIAYFPPVDYEASGVSAIRIEEAKNIIGSGPNTGLRTWEASLRLAFYLWQRQELIRGRNVLELGAGTGFLSILCASQLGANKVVTTDGNAEVLQSLHHNIDLNERLFESRPAPTAQQLFWGDEEAVKGVLQDGAKYDIVLGADITYHPDACIALAGVLRDLVRANPNTEILISATQRQMDTMQTFVDTCTDDDHGLSVQEVAYQCPKFHDQKGFFHTVASPIRIYAIQAA